jgi:putative sigma-54 modulation protein
MKLTISFKHLDHTPALDQRIQEKTEKLTKYFEGNIGVQWVCWVRHEKHYAEIQLHGPGFDFFAKASADNMYKALDLVIEKMERQLEKQKTMRRNRLHGSAHESAKLEVINKLIKDEDDAYEQWEEMSA